MAERDSPILAHIELPGRAWERVTWPQGVESWQESSGGGYRATVIVRVDRAEAVGRAMVRAMEDGTSGVRHAIAPQLTGLIAALARNVGGQH